MSFEKSVNLIIVNEGISQLELVFDHAIEIFLKNKLVKNRLYSEAEIKIILSGKINDYLSEHLKGSDNYLDKINDGYQLK